MIATFYAVDRIEGTIAVLVGDDGSTIEVPKTLLPRGVREGTVLRVGLGSDGSPDWSRASIDKEEQARRMNAVRRQLDEMKRSDPGGDITL